MLRYNLNFKQIQILKFLLTEECPKAVSNLKKEAGISEYLAL